MGFVAAFACLASAIGWYVLDFRPNAQPLVIDGLTTLFEEGTFATALVLAGGGYTWWRRGWTESPIVSQRVWARAGVVFALLGVFQLAFLALYSPDFGSYTTSSFDRTSVESEVTF